MNIIRKFIERWMNKRGDRQFRSNHQSSDDNCNDIEGFDHKSPHKQPSCSLSHDETAQVVKARWCAFVSGLGSLDQAGRRHTRIGEEATPGGIEVQPALRAEPAGRDLRYMHQPMTSGANQLSAVPCQEVS